MRGETWSTNWGEKIASSSDTSCESYDSNDEPSEFPVIAFVSTQKLRQERAYHLFKSIKKTIDPEGELVIKTVEIRRLPALPADNSALVVCIYEYPGENYLERVIDFGPAWYKAKRVGDKKIEAVRQTSKPRESVPLAIFLDFAVGAAGCLEILHHEQRIVHGEIRGDAFHMNLETGSVKLINLGSGLRTFEHGLRSMGWSALSKDIGVRTKLSYMSPEQTGRMATQPDTRTDIYSLGVLFWILLTKQLPFDGATPIDIVQGVLGRRLPPVSSFRLDVPDVVDRIIQKMTAKSITDRYHSTRGLKYDLVEIRKLLGIGDSMSLSNWQIATRDVSPVLILPSVMIGRSEEHSKIVKVIERASKPYFNVTRHDIHSNHSAPSSAEPSLKDFTVTSIEIVNDDYISQKEAISNSFSAGLEYSSQQAEIGMHSIYFPSDFNFGPQNHCADYPELSSSSNSVLDKFLEKRRGSFSSANKSSTDSMYSEPGPRLLPEGAGSLTSKMNSHKRRREGQCEFITISGAAGLGKTCLVQAAQVEARQRGYFASSKFDQAKKAPFGPILTLLSSLFRQVFSESNCETPFHQTLKEYVGPVWPMLCQILGLPEFLLTPTAKPSTNGCRNDLSQRNYNNTETESGKTDWSSPSSYENLATVAITSQSTQDTSHLGLHTRSSRFLNVFLDVLRVFTEHKFICFSLDDLQFADDESIDLLTQIISTRMNMVIIVTFRSNQIPGRISSIIDASNSDIGSSLLTFDLIK